MSLPGTFFETQSGRIFVHRGGVASGEPIVIIHGFMMSHYYFANVIAELEKKYDVIALDLPGFGESDRPLTDRFAYDLPAMVDIVVQVFDQLGLKAPTVIGHSFGGGVALTLASRHPARVGRLIVACPTVFDVPKQIEAAVALTPVVGKFVWKNVFSSREMKRGMRREHTRNPAVVTDEFVDYYWERFSRAHSKSAAYAVLEAIYALRYENADVARVQCPTLILWGDGDQIVPLAHGRRLQRELKNAHLEILAACGHLNHMERPKEWLAAVENFLNEGLSAGRASA